MIGFIDYSEMDNGFMDCWLGDGYTNGASNIQYFYYIDIAHTDFISVNRSGRARAGHASYSSTTTSTVVWPLPRTSCGPVAQHFATEPRLRPSSTVSVPPFPPSSCRRADDLLWPAAAATSAPLLFLRGSLTRRQFVTDTLRATSFK